MRPLVRVRSFAGVDCFHFNATAYDVLIGNLVDDYADARFDSDLTLQFDNLQVTYDGQPRSPSISTVPDGQELIVSYDGSLDEPVNAGSYEVIASAPGWRESLSGVFEILPADQSIEFQVAEQVFDDQGPITLAASATSGLPVSYELLSGPATLSANVLTLTGATGTIVVRASQPGDANWQAAEPVERSIEVVERIDVIFGDRFDSASVQ